MKKTLSLILALTMVLSLALCAGASAEYQRDNLTVALSADGSTFDPFASFVNWGSASMTSLIFQGLIQTDYDYNIYYEIAREITQVDDLHWQVTIYDEVYDSAGSHITIEDDLKEITPQQFRWLMEGLSIYQKKAIKPVQKQLIF